MTQPDTVPPNFTGAAILLDRDGVINHDPGDYTKSRAEVHILPTALEAMKAWYEAGFKLIVITNQGGIAKGKYTHEAVAEIHDYLKSEAQKYYYAGQAPPQNIFNVFAWAQFIEAWKRGDFKRKK